MWKGAKIGLNERIRHSPEELKLVKYKEKEKEKEKED